MKKKAGLLVFFTVFLGILITAVAYAPPSQERRVAMPDDAELLQYFSQEEIQSFRDQLFNIINNQIEIQSMLGHPVPEAEAARRREQPYMLRDEDIARWLMTGVDLGPLDEATGNSLVATEKAWRGSLESVLVKTTPGFPVASYGSECSGYTSNSDVVFWYTLALNTAKLVWIPLSRGCDQVVVALGAGGNASLACIVADEVLQAAELILAQYTICDGDTESAKVAANYERLAYINEQIDSNYQSTIANDNSNKNAIISNDNINATNIIANSNSNKNTIIANDNSNKNAIIANDNSNKDAIIANDNSNKDAIIANDNSNTTMILAALGETQRLVIRTQIEACLAAGLTVALYQLPESQGGYLEIVRDIVTEDIQRLQAVGQRIGNALHFLELGNEAYSQGSYKDAYKNYLHAYNAASSPNG